MASQMGKAAGGAGVAGGPEGAEMGTKNKKGKKDKPNPCQPSTKPKDKKPAKVDTFVPDNTPPGEKKDCTKPMQ